MRSVSCSTGRVQLRVGVETRAGHGSVARCTYLVSLSVRYLVLIRVWCRRIATEIRLDKKLTRANESMSDEEYELLDQDAERTWQLLYAAEIS